jgi:ABC-2 type transport system permease protein
MRQLFHIILYKIKTNTRIDLKLSFGDVFKELGTFLVYASFAVGTFFFARLSIYILLDQLRIGIFLLHQFASIIFFIFFMSVNVGNIVVSWSTLYKSNEINFLFTKPISPYILFIVKFIDNIFYSSSTLILMLVAGFLAYISYFNLNFIELLYILVLNLLPFIIIAASLGVMILLLVVKLATKIGAKNLFISVGVIYLSLLIIFFNTISPMNLVYSVLSKYPNIDIYYGDLIPVSLSLLPNQWFSDSLYWLVTGDLKKSLTASFKQIMTATGFIFLAISLGHQWYYKTWLQNIKISNDKKTSNKWITKIINKTLGSSSRMISIIGKDLVLFFRDSTQTIHSIVLFILILVFMVSTSGISYTKFEDISLVGTVYLSIYIFIVLLVSTLSLRFIFPLISLEGRTYWKIKTSPIHNLELSNYKLIPFSIIIIVTALLLTFFSHIKLAPHLLKYSVVSIIPVSFSLIMMNFAMGIFYVKFSEKNPIRISSSKGASITFLFTIIYMIIISAVLFFPIQEHFTVLLNSNYFMYKYIREAHYYISIFSLLVSVIFYFFGVKALRKDY